MYTVFHQHLAVVVSLFRQLAEGVQANGILHEDWVSLCRPFLSSLSGTSHHHWIYLCGCKGKVLAWHVQSLDRQPCRHTLQAVTFVVMLILSHWCMSSCQLSFNLNQVCCSGVAGASPSDSSLYTISTQNVIVQAKVLIVRDPVTKAAHPMLDESQKAVPGKVYTKVGSLLCILISAQGLQHSRH